MFWDLEREASGALTVFGEAGDAEVSESGSCVAASRRAAKAARIEVV